MYPNFTHFAVYPKKSRKRQDQNRNSSRPSSILLAILVCVCMASSTRANPDMQIDFSKYFLEIQGIKSPFDLVNYHDLASLGFLDPDSSEQRVLKMGIRFLQDSRYERLLMSFVIVFEFRNGDEPFFVGIEYLPFNIIDARYADRLSPSIDISDGLEEIVHFENLIKNNRKSNGGDEYIPLSIWKLKETPVKEEILEYFNFESNERGRGRVLQARSAERRGRESTSRGANLNSWIKFWEAFFRQRNVTKVRMTKAPDAQTKEKAAQKGQPDARESKPRADEEREAKASPNEEGEAADTENRAPKLRVKPIIIGKLVVDRKESIDEEAIPIKKKGSEKAAESKKSGENRKEKERENGTQAETRREDLRDKIQLKNKYIDELIEIEEQLRVEYKVKKEAVGAKRAMSPEHEREKKELIGHLERQRDQVLEKLDNLELEEGNEEPPRKEANKRRKAHQKATNKAPKRRSAGEAAESVEKSFKNMNKLNLPQPPNISIKNIVPLRIPGRGDLSRLPMDRQPKGESERAEGTTVTKEQFVIEDENENINQIEVTTEKSPQFTKRTIKEEIFPQQQSSPQKADLAQTQRAPESPGKDTDKGETESLQTKGPPSPISVKETQIGMSNQRAEELEQSQVNVSTKSDNKPSGLDLDQLDPSDDKVIEDEIRKLTRFSDQLESIFQKDAEASKGPGKVTTSLGKSEALAPMKAQNEEVIRESLEDENVFFEDSEIPEVSLPVAQKKDVQSVIDAQEQEATDAQIGRNRSIDEDAVQVTKSFVFNKSGK